MSDIKSGYMEVLESIDIGGFYDENNRFVNRKPTEKEKEPAKRLSDVYKKTLEMPMKDYLNTIKNKDSENPNLVKVNNPVDTLLAQEDNPEENQKSKDRFQDYLKKNFRGSNTK